MTVKVLKMNGFVGRAWRRETGQHLFLLFSLNVAAASTL